MFLIIAVFLTVGTIGCNGSENKAEPVKLDLKKLDKETVDNRWDSVSYSFGFHTATRIIEDSLPIIQNLYLRGVIDAFDSLRRIDSRLISDSGIVESFKKFDDFRKEMFDKQVAEERRQDSIMAEQMLVQGKELLAKNLKDPDIKVTPSGLQYKVIKEGTGERPQTGGAAKIHFIGTMTNGEEYANTYLPKEQPGMKPLTEEEKKDTLDPIVVPVDRVPPGWSEAMKMMKAGSKYIFYIPAELMYGDRGMQQNNNTIIPPNAVLTMQIEMIGPASPDEIRPPQTRNQPQGPGPNQGPGPGMQMQQMQPPPQGGRR